jgi:hypothetical protein
MHRFEHPPSSALLIGLAALLAAVFAADLFTPVGVAVWVFYFVPVVLAYLGSLRARTVFAEHSLATDAVFAEVQLVTCRNVLIYFQRRLQDRALALFADALPAHGILGLGLRESLRFNAHAPRFRDLVPAVRLYLRQGAR